MSLLTTPFKAGAKAAPVAAVTAGLLASPEEAQAGLFNLGSKFVRNATGPNRVAAQQRGGNRGQRNTSKKASLTAPEKEAIRKSIKGTQVDEASAFNVVREWKMRHPQSDWFVPEVTGVDVGKKGEVKVKTRNQQYKYNIDRKTGKPALPGSRHYNRIVDGVVNEITEVARRADAGDADAKRIMDNAGWYKNVERRLRTEYGSFSGMMADILGATSPNTPVGTNFKFSQDILKRATRGEFDQLMNGFADQLDQRYELIDQAAAYLDTQKKSGRTKKAAKQDPAYIALEDEAKAISKRLQAEANTIKQTSVDPKTGNLKNYGMNSYNSMIALADRWRVLRAGGAPKARNFSGNLSGRSEQATIDVWAARNLRRHAGLKPIPSSAETSVTGNIVDAENFRNSLEFGFGQDVLADATARLNNDLGLDLDPRDLQALQWFAEKDHWTQRGWTSTVGEGGSFETMMDLDPVESTFLGLSREQNMEFQGIDFVPTPAQSEATAKQIVGAGLLDEDVRAVKGMPSIGKYGDPETAMDIDVVSRQDQMPTNILDAAARQAAADKQDSWFIANRVGDQVGASAPQNFNVGSEVYFKDGVPQDAKVLSDIQKDLSDQGIPGYTMIIDPRDSNRVVGVRFLDIPQFYDNEKFARMTSAEYGQHALGKFGEYDEVGRNLKSKYPQIQAAQPGFFDVNVKSGRQTEDYLAQLSNPQRDPDALHQEFYGFKPATTRFREFSGEVQPYYSGSRGRSPSPSPSSQRGSADPRALAATGLLGAAAAPTLANLESKGRDALQRGQAGLLDAALNTGAAAIAPYANVPHTLIQALTGDRSTEQIKKSRDARAASMDYQPRTQIGQTISDEGLRALGGILAPLIAAGKPITEPLQKLYGLLPPRAQLVGETILDAF